MEIKTSVITPIWNRADLTRYFLWRNATLYQSRPDVEFVIVDNASTDETQEVLGPFTALFSDRLVIQHNEENVGFGPGHNLGANLAAGEVLIFLSNDVIIANDYITPIEKALAEQPDALVGPELLRHDTGWNTFDGQTIPYLAGWCVACRRDTWDDKLGGWDERYVPCDYEDIDLSYTATQIGIPLVEVPLPLEHMFGQSAQSLGGGRLQITHQSQAKFKEKWGFG